MSEEQLHQFLLAPDSYRPLPGEEGTQSVQHLETHISHIYLTGEYAYKRKKPVRLPFLDFSTLKAREEFCRREVDLNKRYAPELYLGVQSIYRSGQGAYSFSALGDQCELLVRMKRFSDGHLLRELLKQGELEESTIDLLLERVVSFHASAEHTPAFGGIQPFWKRFGDTLQTIRENGGDPSCVEELQRIWGAEAERHTPLFQIRSESMVRRLHGDLHLGNICLYKGKPLPFDGIEFSDELSCIDTWEDIAFLIMDLFYEQHPVFAWRAANQYLEQSGDFAGAALLPLFIAYRAAVRAKIAFIRLSQMKADRSRSEAERYLALALQPLGVRKPCLAAVGGVSGSGKSTRARELSKEGALHIRSDAVRKHLWQGSLEGQLPEEAYRKEFSSKVYEEMRKVAGAALRAGLPVILDATFLEQAEREGVEQLASDHSVPFQGIWCEVSPAVARERLRKRKGDISDADLSVLERQLRREKITPAGWEQQK